MQPTGKLTLSPVFVTLVASMVNPMKLYLISRFILMDDGQQLISRRRRCRRCRHHEHSNKNNLTLLCVTESLK